MNSRRWFAVGMTLASVLVLGWKSVIPGLDLGSGSGSGSVGDTASALVLLPAFTRASLALQTYAGTNGTYTGATLAADSPVRVVWATGAAYCLEAGMGSTAEHQVGPGSALPSAGPCPAAT